MWSVHQAHAAAGLFTSASVARLRGLPRDSGMGSRKIGSYSTLLSYTLIVREMHHGKENRACTLHREWYRAPQPKTKRRTPRQYRQENLIHKRYGKVRVTKTNGKHHPKMNKLLTHAIPTARGPPHTNVYAKASEPYSTPLSSAPMNAICTRQSTRAALGPAQAYDG
jgi:hypothetical protein